MSSYLNIYVKTKEKDSKPLSLTSFSRNSDVYQIFNENFNLYSSEGEKKEITDSMMNQIEANLIAEINKAKNRYETYLEFILHKEKNKNLDSVGNCEAEQKDKNSKEESEYDEYDCSVEELISWKEYIKDLEDCKAQLSVLHEIIWECDCKTSDFEKVLAYID